MHQTEAVEQERSDSKLKKGISGKLLFLFILGDVLGAGIYALVGVIAGEVGGAIWVPMLIALLLALLTAASYAELVTKYPRAGGAAVFAERAYRKPMISFLVGYAMLAAGVTSAAGLSIAFAGYFTEFLPGPQLLITSVFLIAVALLNARGIKESVRSNVVMTVIEVSGLILVIVLVALMLGAGDGEIGRVTDFRDGVSAPVAVLGAALIAYYSFVGFEVSANVAEEVQNVRKVYPKALFGALLTAGVVYVLIGLAASVTLSPQDLESSDGPLLAVVEATGFGIPSWLFGTVALIAVANGALLTMIMASRLTYGMAEEGLLPAVFGRVLPNRRTPWVAIVVTTAVALVLTFTGGLAALAETVVLLLLFVFLSTNIAVLVVRKDEVEEKHFTAPTIVPVLAILSCLVLLTQQDGAVWLRAGILMAIGVGLYLLTRIKRQKTTEHHEELHHGSN